MCRNKSKVRASLLACLSVVLLGGCSLSNTARGAGDVFSGFGSLISGMGQDMSLAADGSDAEVARRVNDSGSSRFGNGTNASNASWNGLNHN